MLFILHENSLKEGLYRDYLDWETAINWYLVQEATINVEAWASRNLFLYKPRGDSKFYIGPPWDFDAWTFGYRSVYTPEIFDCKNIAFYYRYLFNDPEFVSRLKEKWNNSIKDIWMDSIPKFIDAQYLYLHRSAERNERLFPQCHFDYNHPETSYKESVEHMKHGVIHDLIRKLKEHPSSLEVFGDGTHTKPYWIDDLVEGVMTILNKTNEPYNTYLVGVDSNVTVDQIIQIVMDEVGVHVPIHYGGKYSGWKGDVRQYRYDVSQLRLMGWTPKYSAEQAIRKAVQVNMNNLYYY